MGAILVLIILFLVDYYGYQSVYTLTKTASSTRKRLWKVVYWLPTLIGVALLLLYFVFQDPTEKKAIQLSFIITYVFGVFLAKLFATLILFLEDVKRGLMLLIQTFRKKPQPKSASQNSISRSEFMSKAALLAATIPVTTMSFGILSGAHDYQVRRKTIYLKNLPKAFDGIRIGQLSDIHSGSFFNKTAVKGGIELFLREKPDVIFFTGDLVNDEAAEVKSFIDIFNKIKAPLGTYSVTGNHDYGDYKTWKSEEAKNQNFADLIHAHKALGFDLLMNENRLITVNGQSIAVLGNENWGGGNFIKKGDLRKAYHGVEDVPTKLLLSHDPSHWDAQVRSQFPDIDVMFAGHTHGFQFGVEVGDYQWSPSKYIYKQWGGLYQEVQQYLYVNRGFGYLGYPGRIGIAPEVTVIELKRLIV
jgi:predicted MPP superfamily phosphohydrolase